MLIDKITELIQFKIPFAFARYNDGEMGGIINSNFTASRGAQHISTPLANKLIEGLEFKKENYWIGIPCKLCYPLEHEVANNIVGEYEYKTLAVNLINRNYNQFKNHIVPLIAEREIYWVGGEDQDLQPLGSLGFNILKQHKLPVINAFSKYEEIKNLYRSFNPNSLVILSLGPLERILVKEWFEKTDTVTYLGLGSTFDPWTRGVTHRYHNGSLPACFNCN